MIDANDVFAFLGLLLVGIGLWMVRPELSLTVVGAILLGLAILGAAPRRKGKE